MCTTSPAAAAAQGEEGAGMETSSWNREEDWGCHPQNKVYLYKCLAGAEDVGKHKSSFSALQHVLLKAPAAKGKQDFKSNFKPSEWLNHI